MSTATTAPARKRAQTIALWFALVATALTTLLGLSATAAHAMSPAEYLQDYLETQCEVASSCSQFRDPADPNGLRLLPATAFSDEEIAQFFLDIDICRGAPAGCEERWEAYLTPASGPASSGGVADTELLPAYRWGSGTTDLTTFALDSGNDLLAQLIGLVSALMLTLSSWIWAMLLATLEMAHSTAMALQLQKYINANYLKVHNLVAGSGLAVLVLAGLAISLLKQGLNPGRSKMKAPVIVLGTFAALGASTGLAHLSTGGAYLEQLLNCVAESDQQEQQWRRNGDTDVECTDHDTTGVTRLSPGWFAYQGAQLSDTLSNQISERMITADSNALNERDSGSMCDRYLNTLYSRYQAGLSGGASDKSATLMLGSKMWDSTMYRYWSSAQFSSEGTSGQEAACHRLEHAAGVSPTEARYNSALAYGPLLGQGAVTTEADLTKAAGHEANYKPASNPEQDSGRTLTWAMCTIEGGQVVAHDDWTTVRRGRTGADTRTEDPITDEDCATWWTSGVTPDASFYDKDQIIPQTEWHDGHETARPVAVAWIGKNVSERLFNALFALLTAGAYLWSFGAMAIGSVVAQVALLFLLAILPISFLLIAISYSGGSAKELSRTAGGKMLKTTGGMLFTKLLFTTSLAFMFLIIDVVNNVSGMIVGGTGVMQDLVLAGGPLASVFILKSTLKMMGLGDITKLSGAVSMPAAAALKVAGEDSAARSLGSNVGQAGKGVSRAAGAPGRAWKKTTKAAKSMAKAAESARAAGAAVANSRIGSAAGAAVTRANKHFQATAGAAFADRVDESAKQGKLLGRVLGRRNEGGGTSASGRASQPLAHDPVSEVLSEPGKRLKNVGTDHKGIDRSRGQSLTAGSRAAEDAAEYWGAYVDGISQVGSGSQTPGLRYDLDELDQRAADIQSLAAELNLGDLPLIVSPVTGRVDLSPYATDKQRAAMQGTPLESLANSPISRLDDARFLQAVKQGNADLASELGLALAGAMGALHIEAGSKKHPQGRVIEHAGTETLDTSMLSSATKSAILDALRSRDAQRDQAYLSAAQELARISEAQMGAGASAAGGAQAVTSAVSDAITEAVAQAAGGSFNAQLASQVGDHLNRQLSDMETHISDAVTSMFASYTESEISLGDVNVDVSEHVSSMLEPVKADLLRHHSEFESALRELNIVLQAGANNPKSIDQSRITNLHTRAVAAAGAVSDQLETQSVAALQHAMRSRLEAERRDLARKVTEERISQPLVMSSRDTLSRFGGAGREYKGKKKG